MEVVLVGVVVVVLGVLVAILGAELQVIMDPWSPYRRPLQCLRHGPTATAAPATQCNPWFLSWQGMEATTPPHLQDHHGCILKDDVYILNRSSHFHVRDICKIREKLSDTFEPLQSAQIAPRTQTSNDLV